MPLIIRESVVWEAGVHELTDDVQIAPGATLTIAPGAEVIGNGHLITVFGGLIADGDSLERVGLTGVRLTFGNNSGTPGSITLDHVDFTSGTFLPANGNASYGAFSVTNSVFTDAGASYVWYPTSQSVFERNVFVRSGGLSIGTSFDVDVIDNVFVDWSNSYVTPGAVGVWATYSGARVRVEGNAFLNVGQVALSVAIDGRSIDAAGNWFGTTDSAIIDTMILDQNDDLNRPTVISHEPDLSGIGSGVLAAVGTSLGDVLTARRVQPVLLGLDGDDTLKSSAFSDILDGGGGFDTVSYAAASGAVELNLRDGVGVAYVESIRDSLWSIEGAVGSRFDDRLIGDSRGNVLDGRAGNDVLQGNGGNDTLIGWVGNDVIDGGDGDDLIDGGAGNDSLEGGVGSDVILGGAGDDTITDVGGSDRIDAGAGNDSLQISRGDDGSLETVAIQMGTGNDSVIYQNYRAGSASIDLGAGNDSLTIWTVQVGGLRVATGEGRDVISLTALLDIHTNGRLAFTDFAAGDDGDRLEWSDLLDRSLQGWNGSANPFGRSGYLRLVQDGDATVVEIDRDGRAGREFGFTPLLTFEHTSASALSAFNLDGFAPDGSAAPDARILGNKGNNELTGTAGRDLILGRAGNDIIDGGAGADRIDGGAGNDTISGGSGDDRLSGGDGDDYISDIGGSNVIDGGAGNDFITQSTAGGSRSENVTILAGEGDDYVSYQNYRPGSLAVDLGGGDDFLQLWTIQNGGAEIVTGTGSDTIKFAPVLDFLQLGEISVRDFQAGDDGDRFDWNDYLSQVLQGWDRVDNPFGEVGYLRLSQSGDDVIVEIDRDGSAGGSYGFEALVTLENTAATSLTAYNFSGWTPQAADLSLAL